MKKKLLSLSDFSKNTDPPSEYPPSYSMHKKRTNFFPTIMLKKLRSFSVLM